MIFKAGERCDSQFNNPDICIEKKQPEPGVLAGTPINVKICTELAPWLYRVSLAPSLKSGLEINPPSTGQNVKYPA